MGTTTSPHASRGLTPSPQPAPGIHQEAIHRGGGDHMPRREEGRPGGNAAPARMRALRFSPFCGFTSFKQSTSWNPTSCNPQETKEIQFKETTSLISWFLGVIPFLIHSHSLLSASKFRCSYREPTRRLRDQKTLFRHQTKLIPEDQQK